MRDWLFKTEPDAYSIDDLARDGRTRWDGIRNYQARNRLRDEVNAGDRVLVYHSSCAVPAVVGIATVGGTAEPDPSQFDPESPYYDPRSSPQAPRWVMVTLAYQAHLPTPVTLKQIKTDPVFAELELVHRGRLSIQVVDPHSAALILERGGLQQ